MADTINTNSFFNQPEGEGGGISSVQVLAQNSFDIATNIRAQFRDFVQTFDKYKLDAGESDRLISNTVSNLDIETDQINKTLEEFKKNFESLEDDIRGQDKKITDIEAKVDEVSEVFYKFEQSQKAAAEKAADDAFRAQDAAQKAGDKKDGGVAAGGLGGLASMMGVGDKGSGGGDDKKKKPGNFWKNPWMWGLMGAGAIHGMGAGIKRGIGGAADFLTGGLFDFDKRSGGGGLRKIGSGLKNMFGGKKKDKEKGVKAEVDNLESRVDALESGNVKGDGSYTIKDSDFSQEDKDRMFEIEEEMALLEEQGKVFSPEYEKLEAENDAIIEKYSGKGKIESKEGTDEKGLKPKGEEGEKKEKGLFGGFFGGLFGKKKEEKPSGTESKSISTSESATMQRGKVVSGNMSQEDAEKNSKLLDLESDLMDAEIDYGPNSPEANEIQKKIMILKGTPEEAIYTDKEGNVKTKGYSTFEGKTTISGEKGEGGGFKRAVGGFADFMTGGIFDFDKQNRKGAPKDFGIRRMAGGVADAMTMGLTDFDKRGKGNFQFDPLFGGKDKAWGSADEQAKRREKQSGMGIKRGIGGALDFATLGTFDFDKQNKEGAPKGWGIKRVAGGLADAITMGTTDFDKRGAGIFQYDGFTGGKGKGKDEGRNKKWSGKTGSHYGEDGSFYNYYPIEQPRVKNQAELQEYVKNNPEVKGRPWVQFGDHWVLQTEEQANQDKERTQKLAAQGNTMAQEKLKNWSPEENISPVPSQSGANFKDISQQPEGRNIPQTQLLPIPMPSGDNTSSNVLNQMMTDKGDFQTDDDTADGTACTIECINMMKLNSTRQIMN